MNWLADRMRQHDLLLGTWLSLGSPVVAELASQCGFDWLAFDLEHGCGTEATLLANLQATRGANTARVVRVGHPHAEVILRALDWGADGIMVPHVSSADEAEQIVQAAHYAPRGHRGVSRSVRAYSYGLSPPEPGDMPRPLLLAQIETLEGVVQADQIAAVDGIDVLFVGPADLRFELDARKSPQTYDACLDQIAAAAQHAGKQCGILLRNANDLEAMTRRGMTWIAVDSDLAILREGLRRIVGDARPRPN